MIPSLLLDIDPLFVGGVFGMNFENFRKKPHGVKKCLHLGAKICVRDQITCVIQLYI